MADLYYLSFRDIASASTGVTAGEVYALDGVGPDTAWPGAGVSGANWVPWDKVPDLFRNKRVCFVVHGFNVDRDRGVRGGGPVSQECEGLGSLGLAISSLDMVVTVLWPGDGFLGWSWFTAYDHSKTTGARFAAFLVSSAFTASEVSFVSHSLGARVVLETVAQTVPLHPRFAFGAAVLAAAAVDDNALDDPEYAVAAAALRRIVILSSRMDEVLKVFFTLGSIAEQALWSSYDGDARALGRYGPAFTAGSPAPPKTEWYEIQPQIGQDHGDYLPAPWLAPRRRTDGRPSARRSGPSAATCSTGANPRRTSPIGPTTTPPGSAPTGRRSSERPRAASPPRSRR